MKNTINYSRFKFVPLLFVLAFVTLFTSCNSDDDAASDITRVSMKTLPQLNYILGNTLNLSDMVITINRGGSNTDIPFSGFAGEGITTEPENGKVLDFSDKSVTVKIGTTGKGLIQTINVTNDVTAMEIKTEPIIDYFSGQKLDLTNMVVTYSYQNGDMKDFTFSEIQKELETVPANGAGLVTTNTEVSITHISTGINVVQELNVSRFFPLNGVLVNGPTKSEYTVGNFLDLSGTTIRYNLLGGGEAEIGSEDFEALRITANPKNGDALEAGITEVKVRHTFGAEVSIPITVNP